MRTPFLFGLLLVGCLDSHAQNKTGQPLIDSLMSVLPTMRPDSHQVIVLNALSYEYRRSKPDTGLAYAQRSIRLAQSLGYTRGLAGAYRVEGINLYRLSQYPKALSAHTQAAVLFEQTGDRAGQAANFNNIGNIYLAQSDYHQALPWYQKALRINEFMGNKQEQASNLINIGNIYFHNTDYGQALACYQKNLSIYDALGNKTAKALCLGNIGSVYLQLSDYPRALGYFQQSLALYQDIGDATGLADCYTNLADLSELLLENDNALQYYRQALAVWEDQGDKVEQAKNLNGIGNVYFNQSDYENSTKYYQKALHIYELLDSKEGQAVVLNNLGGICENQGDLPQAFSCYRRSLAISENMGNKNLQGVNLNKIGNIYFKETDYRRAMECQEKALTYAREAGVQYLEQDVLESLSLIYEKQGDHTRAYGAFKEHIALRDSILGQDTRKKITRMEIQFEFDKKETEFKYQQQLTEGQLLKERLLANQRTQELRLRSQQLSLSNKEKDIQRLAYLKERSEKQEKEQQLTLSEKEKQLQSVQLTNLGQQAELQAANLKAQTQQRNMLLAGTGLLLLFSFLLYRNFQIQKKSNRLLAEVNDKLGLKNAENELLLKEIHHRVKNNLQTISSLLNLQSATIKDVGALEAVAQSQSRVRSMALIHQKLYQGENLAGVDMKDYLETMVNAIHDSFGAKAENIALVVDMPPLEMDVDTAIPIGLIVNELVTNALKYAFPNNTAGQVRIRLTREPDQRHCLSVSDNGVGLPTDASQMSPESAGFGTRLVQLLAMQLQGKLHQESSPGFTTTLHF